MKTSKDVQKVFSSLLNKINNERPVVKAIAETLLTSEELSTNEIILAINGVCREHQTEVDTENLVHFWHTTGNTEYWNIAEVTKNFSLYGSKMYCYETIKKYLK
jgi:hypothetical protein